MISITGTLGSGYLSCMTARAEPLSQSPLISSPDFSDGPHFQCLHFCRLACLSLLLGSQARALAIIASTKNNIKLKNDRSFLDSDEYGLTASLFICFNHNLQHNNLLFVTNQISIPIPFSVSATQKKSHLLAEHSKKENPEKTIQSKV